MASESSPSLSATAPEPEHISQNSETYLHSPVHLPVDRTASSDSSQSPYYLHHHDTSTLVLVSELLMNNNYVTWSRSMLLALSIRNKIGFVDGSIQKPAGNLLPQWISNNNVVISWILTSVSKSISSSILFSESAREIWLDLKERFQRKNGPRIFQLKRQIATLIQDQDSVTTYFSKLKSLWDELVTYRPCCTCAMCICDGRKKIEEFFEHEYLLCFLMGLNESFGHARSQILSMEPPPSINKAFSLIAQEEQQQRYQSYLKHLQSVLPSHITQMFRTINLAKTDQFVLTVVELDTLWTDAIKFMVIHQDFGLDSTILPLPQPYPTQFPW